MNMKPGGIIGASVSSLALSGKRENSFISTELNIKFYTIKTLKNINRLCLVCEDFNYIAYNII